MTKDALFFSRKSQRHVLWLTENLFGLFVGVCREAY